MGADIRRVLFNLLEEVSNMKLIGVSRSKLSCSSAGRTDSNSFYTTCTTGKVFIFGSGSLTNSNTGVYCGIFDVSTSSGTVKSINMGNITGVYSVGSTLASNASYGTVTINSTGITLTSSSSNYVYYYNDFLVFEWED